MRNHLDRQGAHQGAATGAIGKPVTRAHDVNGPAPSKALAQPSAAVKVGPGFMARAAGRAVALCEALIATTSFAGQRGARVVLGTAKGPLIVKCPHQGHGQAADLLD